MKHYRITLIMQDGETLTHAYFSELQMWALLEALWADIAAFVCQAV